MGQKIAEQLRSQSQSQLVEGHVGGGPVSRWSSERRAREVVVTSGPVRWTLEFPIQGKGDEFKERGITNANKMMTNFTRSPSSSPAEVKRGIHEIGRPPTREEVMRWPSSMPAPTVTVDNQLHFPRPSTASSGGDPRTLGRSSSAPPVSAHSVFHPNAMNKLKMKLSCGPGKFRTTVLEKQKKKEKKEKRERKNNLKHVSGRKLAVDVSSISSSASSSSELDEEAVQEKMSPQSPTLRPTISVRSPTTKNLQLSMSSPLSSSESRDEAPSGAVTGLQAPPLPAEQRSFSSEGVGPTSPASRRMSPLNPRRRGSRISQGSSPRDESDKMSDTLSTRGLSTLHNRRGSRRRSSIMIDPRGLAALISESGSSGRSGIVNSVKNLRQIQVRSERRRSSNLSQGHEEDAFGLNEASLKLLPPSTPVYGRKHLTEALPMDASSVGSKLSRISSALSQTLSGVAEGKQALLAEQRIGAQERNELRGALRQGMSHRVQDRYDTITALRLERKRIEAAKEAKRKKKSSYLSSQIGEGTAKGRFNREESPVTAQIRNEFEQFDDEDGPEAETFRKILEDRVNEVSASLLEKGHVHPVYPDILPAPSPSQLWKDDSDGYRQIITRKEVAERLGFEEPTEEWNWSDAEAEHSQNAGPMWITSAQLRRHSVHLSIVPPIHAVAALGTPDDLHKMIQAGWHQDTRNVLGETPLFFAVKHRNLGNAQVLVEYWKCNVMARAAHRTNVLHAIAFGGCVETLSYILPYMSHPRVVAEVDDTFCTPLHIAAERGHAEIVKLLLALGVDANVRDKDFVTPLHCAALNIQIKKRGALDTVEALLTAGADINARDREGYSPFHKIAALIPAEDISSVPDSNILMSSHQELIRTMVDAAMQVNPRQDESEGEVREDYLQQYLNIANGSSPNTATPEFPPEEAVDGGDRDSEQRHTQRQEGEILPPGRRLSSRGSTRRLGLPSISITTSEEDALDVGIQKAKLLLGHTADINDVSFANETPLHVAASVGYSDLVAFLLNNGADVSVVSADSKTAGDVAVGKARELLQPQSAPPAPKNADVTPSRKLEQYRGKGALENLDWEPMLFLCFEKGDYFTARSFCREIVERYPSLQVFLENKMDTRAAETLTGPFEQIQKVIHNDLELSAKLKEARQAMRPHTTGERQTSRHVGWGGAQTRRQNRSTSGMLRRGSASMKSSRASTPQPEEEFKLPDTPDFNKEFKSLHMTFEEPQAERKSSSGSRPQSRASTPASMKRLQSSASARDPFNRIESRGLFDDSPLVEPEEGPDEEEEVDEFAFLSGGLEDSTADASAFHTELWGSHRVSKMVSKGLVMSKGIPFDFRLTSRLQRKAKDAAKRRHAFQQSDILVVLLSKHSIDKPTAAVKQELAYGLKQGKLVIPVLLDSAAVEASRRYVSELRGECCHPDQLSKPFDLSGKCSSGNQHDDLHSHAVRVRSATTALIDYIGSDGTRQLAWDVAGAHTSSLKNKTRPKTSSSSRPMVATRQPVSSNPRLPTVRSPSPNTPSTAQRPSTSQGFVETSDAVGDDEEETESVWSLGLSEHAPRWCKEWLEVQKRAKVPNIMERSRRIIQSVQRQRKITSGLKADVPWLGSEKMGQVEADEMNERKSMWKEMETKLDQGMTEVGKKVADLSLGMVKKQDSKRLKKLKAYQTANFWDKYLIEQMISDSDSVTLSEDQSDANSEHEDDRGLAEVEVEHGSYENENENENEVGLGLEGRNDNGGEKAASGDVAGADGVDYEGDAEFEGQEEEIYSEDEEPVFESLADEILYHEENFEQEAWDVFDDGPELKGIDLGAPEPEPKTEPTTESSHRTGGKKDGHSDLPPVKIKGLKPVNDSTLSARSSMSRVSTNTLGTLLSQRSARSRKSTRSNKSSRSFDTVESEGIGDSVIRDMRKAVKRAHREQRLKEKEQEAKASLLVEESSSDESDQNAPEYVRNAKAANLFNRSHAFLSSQAVNQFDLYNPGGIVGLPVNFIGHFEELLDRSRSKDKKVRNKRPKTFSRKTIDTMKPPLREVKAQSGSHGGGLKRGHNRGKHGDGDALPSTVSFGPSDTRFLEPEPDHDDEQ